jgi:hypothetical protein
MQPVQIRREIYQPIPGSYCTNRIFAWIPEVTDVDGNVEERKGTVSVFNGPPPRIAVLESAEKERQAVAEWIKDLIASRVAPSEIGIFIRSDEEIARGRAAAEVAFHSP